MHDVVEIRRFLSYLAGKKSKTQEARPQRYGLGKSHPRCSQEAHPQRNDRCSTVLDSADPRARLEKRAFDDPSAFKDAASP